MKLLTVIVTYFPDKEQLEHNINSLTAGSDYIIIWENTPADEVNYDRSEFLKLISGKGSFQGEGRNVGIGKALNFAADYALKNGFTHLLTMDQDSYFMADSLAEFKQKILQCPIPDVGIFGVNYSSTDSYLYSMVEAYLLQEDCITSGSIVPCDTFRKGLFFDEELFIDAVDFDFCYKIKKDAGLKTVICTDIKLNHQLGYLTKTKFGFHTNNYSAFRTYYIVRNQLLIWKRYRQFPAARKKSIIKDYILMRSLKILIAEEDKAGKLASIAKGILHALQNKTGNIYAK